MGVGVYDAGVGVNVAVGTGVNVAVGTGVNVAVGGTGVNVAVGTGVNVAVGGTGVFVAVGGTGVFVAVGGTGVNVAVGTGVFVAVGSGVNVAVGGTGVNVAVAGPSFVSAAPKHLVALVGQQVRKIRLPESVISTYASERLSTPAAAACKLTTARGADTPAPMGSVGSSVELMQSMLALPRSAGSPVLSLSHRG